jgi:hypothetical protein
MVGRGTDCGTNTPSRVIVLSWPRPEAVTFSNYPVGAFRVSVYAGTDPLTGRQIRLRRTCKTERAAKIELGRLLAQAAAGRQPETDATVAQLMDRYAEVADWDLSTRKANEYYIRRVIKPALGHLQVSLARPARRPPGQRSRGPSKSRSLTRHVARDGQHVPSMVCKMADAEDAPAQYPAGQMPKADRLQESWAPAGTRWERPSRPAVRAQMPPPGMVVWWARPAGGG